MSTDQLAYLDAMGIDVWVERADCKNNHFPEKHESDVQSTGTLVSPARSISSDLVEKKYIPKLSLATDTDTWDTLKDKVLSCVNCELHTSRTQAVFGVGNPSAELLVIGEAPGAEEDKQGEPFVGRGGQLLNAMLLAIGLKREQIYIANILKCRPPNNRDPKPEEVVCCDSYLKRQIEMIQPKVILCVGRIAAQNLLKEETPIGKMRGQQYVYEPLGIPVIVTYHPAYLLRSPTQKDKTWSDLLLASALLELS